MALIAPSPAGGAITYAAASGGGDTMATGLRLHVKNGGVGSINVTITAYGPCSHGFLHDLVFAVPPGSDRIINPPDASRFQNPSGGLVAIAYSGVTSVTVAAF